MIKEPQKKNLSSMQVFKTFQVLLEGEYTMAELIEKLNSKEPDAIFNNSVISKYINTCRFCGIQIPKIHNRYLITDIPFGLHLTDGECDSLNELKIFIETNMSSRVLKIFNKFTEKINRFASKKISKIQKSNSWEFFEIFERAIANKKMVKLLFRNNFNITGIPITIKSAKNKFFAQIHVKGRDRMIDVSRLSGIQILNETFSGYNPEQEIVFELKDNLAKRYDLRKNEVILSSNSDNISVSNKCNNVSELLSRLLRYDNKCEVKNPKPIREMMKNEIDETLKNYGIK